MIDKFEGKFVCIEGPDGSGKQTQFLLLGQKLINKGYNVTLLDFPQYQETFFGEMAGWMFSGKYGPMENIDPHLACLPLAFDRWQASIKIKETKSEGGIVVANRFTLSNLAHQTARMPEGKRENFINFILKLENEVLEIPTPDLYIHLDVPTEISEVLIVKKLQRKYLDNGTNIDELEKDKHHQMEALRMYKKLSSSMKNIITVECCLADGSIKSPDEIHNDVWFEISRFLAINPEGQPTNPERHS